nr:J domain-containing protein [Halomarina oriensis]
MERTPLRDRKRRSSFRVSLGQTTEELTIEIDRLDPDEWRASTGSGGAHTKANGLPKYSANPDDPGFVLRWSKDGEQFAVACDRYSSLRDNVRTVYLWVHETRMRGQRPVVTGGADFAAARLPAGDVDVGTDIPPHQILDVPRDADDATVRSAARDLAKETHPDAGGDREAFQRVQSAKEAMLDG